MKGVKIISAVILVLLVLDLPLILYLSSLDIVAFSSGFYKKEFTKYKIYDEFPEDDIDVVNSELLDYLKHEKTDSYVSISLFDEREKQHLLDVKNLIQVGFLVLNISIILTIILLILLWWIDKANFVKNISLYMLWGGIITFAEGVLFFLAVMINFDAFFTAFHKTFFKNGTWLFNQGSNMITLYTSQFFSDAAIRIALLALGSALVFTALGFILYRRKSKK